MLQFMKIDNIAGLSLIIEECISSNDIDINDINQLNEVKMGLVTSLRLYKLETVQIKQLYYLGCMLRKSKPWIAFAAMFENWDYMYIINMLAANEKENV